MPCSDQEIKMSVQNEHIMFGCNIVFIVATWARVICPLKA